MNVHVHNRGYADVAEFQHSRYVTPRKWVLETPISDDDDGDGDVLRPRLGAW